MLETAKEAIRWVAECAEAASDRATRTQAEQRVGVLLSLLVEGRPRPARHYR